MKIDFTDLIDSVQIDPGQETNYDDKYLDNHDPEWNNVLNLIASHKSIKKVCFTRRSFGGIPKMKKQISEIKEYCESNGIQFQYLVTPARFYSEPKLHEWKKLLIG
jgi:hypothetical protein